MKKIIIICLIIATVISVSADKIHSAKLSFFMSAAIPGAGDFYSRNYTKGSIALVTELALIASLLHFNQIASDYGQSSKIFANNVLGVSLHNDADYFQLIGNHLSSDAYNENVRLNAQNYYGYGTEAYNEFMETYQIKEDQAWDWESLDNQMRYRKYRSDQQKNKQYKSFVIGTVIVNHLYSAISSAMKTNSQNRQFIERHTLNLQPDLINKGVSLTYGFKF